jgi:hypothetical protein
MNSATRSSFFQEEAYVAISPTEQRQTRFNVSIGKQLQMALGGVVLQKPEEEHKERSFAVHL